MRILISGGGIAGLTAAYWLEQYGMTPVVVETAPAVRPGGYGIDFFGTGYDVAERMGLVAALSARQIPADFLGIVDGGGKLLAKLHIQAMREALGGKYLPLMHHSLEQELYNAVRERVEVRFNESVTRIEQTPHGVEVAFERGQPETYDLLVGADGIHSNVRALVFGAEAEYSHYMSYYVASYSGKREPTERAWLLYPETKRQAGLYPNGEPGETNTLFVWEQLDVGPIPRQDRLSTLRERFGGAGWVVPELLAMADENTPIFMDTVTQIRMKGWSRGRVVLVGDACDCLTLISGQGSAMAMGGAFILAQELKRNSSYADAFAYYEHRMRPQVELRQEKAKSLAKTFVPGSETALVVQRFLMQILMRDRFAHFLEQQLIGTSILLTQALMRLDTPDTNILGYRLVGKPGPTDYETLRLDLERALTQRAGVRLLLQVDELKGVEASAFKADIDFGREFRHGIEKLAVVGDSRFAAALGKLSQPLYAQASRAFGSDEMDAAYAWLAE